MGVEHASKRSRDQIDANDENGKSSLQSSESSHHHISTANGSDDITRVGQEPPHDPINSVSEDAGSSKQALPRSQERASEATRSSKRPCLEEGGLLDGADSPQRRVPPYAATSIFRNRESASSNYGDGPSAFEVIIPKSLEYKSRPMLDPKPSSTRRQQWPPAETIPSSSLPRIHRSETDLSRPTFNQLATDGQQGVKVLFLIDHATKGDAIHHNLKPFFPSPSSSSEMKLLTSKFYSHRSHFQNRYFAKARTICAQLTSRRQFIELETETGELVSSGRANRLAYFSEKFSKVHLATLYSHLASAIDISQILLARTRNDRAFKNLMTQVFIHSMEDLWCFEFHPSKQNLSAKREKENKDDVYNRFRGLTDREDGLPAAKDLPGYVEVPLTAKFPRYVLFGQGGRPGDGEEVDESDNVGGDEEKDGGIPHLDMPAE